MKTNIKITLVILLTILMNSLLMGQLTQITAPNMVSEANVYEDVNKTMYSTLVTFKFKQKMVDMSVGAANVNENGILYPAFKQLLNSLRSRYGDFSIKKAIPNENWGDTLKINKRTNELVRVNDLSQIYRLEFENPVPVDEVADLLKSSSNVKYAEGPIVAYLTTSPDDPWYEDEDYRWSFDVINAEGAWDITTGSPLIGIGINDLFGGVAGLHEDLDGKVVWEGLSSYGNHGIIVAGALTNNDLDIASLGWNTKLLLDDWTLDGIEQLVYHGADVINFSWHTSSYPALSDMIEWVLQQGRVCVAAAGNNETPLPGVRYPAAYNFGEDGQVIAVSGTELDNGTEQFKDGFNYSPGTDPESNPTTAFIDCSAPGTNYRALNPDGTTGTVHIFSGTSISAPFVSALVGLMLSVNSTLTPPEIYDIIRRTTDRIGQYSYDANGWNRYMGYGRIDAANAVNVANGAPAKPRDVSLSWSSNHPRIDWEAGEEADLDHYEVYKKKGTGSYSYYASTTNTYYVDNAEVKYSKPNTKIYVYYKVIAVDEDDDESVFSDEVRGAVNDYESKRTTENEDLIQRPDEYKLSANYPNPFNPTTAIKYQLAKDSYVTLSIYNMLGEEVAELVNEFEEAGYYSLQFDAKNLPSGMYIYKIQAGEFSDVKKMLLLK